MSTHFKELNVEIIDFLDKDDKKDKSKGKAKAKPTAKDKDKEKERERQERERQEKERLEKDKLAKAKGKAKTDLASLRPSPTASDTFKGGFDDFGSATPPLLPEGGMLSHFNRFAIMRVLQQVGYFMCNQDDVMEEVLSKGAGTQVSSPGGKGMRGNRYVSVTDKLFEMADRATHDHCSFVLSVVLFHMLLRALLLRVVYHRAAVAIQVRYRYQKLKGHKANAIVPVTRIQRCWRGLRAALSIMRKDDAAWKIQRSYKARNWNVRAKQLLSAVLKIQRVWHSSVHRKWIRGCHTAATVIQRYVRGFQLRISLDKNGRALAKRYQAEAEALVSRRSHMTETEYIARTAVLAGKARMDMDRNRQRNLELIRMAGAGTKSDQARALEKQRRLRFKGAIQPARQSVFEPLIFALARLDAAMEARYGARTSRVMQQVAVARKALERSLPRAQALVPHVAVRRGRAALFVRRVNRKTREAKAAQPLVPQQDSDEGPDLKEENQFNEFQFSQFVSWQLAVKQP